MFTSSWVSRCRMTVTSQNVMTPKNGVLRCCTTDIFGSAICTSHPNLTTITRCSDRELFKDELVCGGEWSCLYSNGVKNVTEDRGGYNLYEIPGGLSSRRMCTVTIIMFPATMIFTVIWLLSAINDAVKGKELPD